MTFQRFAMEKGGSATLSLFLGGEPVRVLAPGGKANAVADAPQIAPGTAGSILVDATHCDHGTLRRCVHEARQALRSDGRIGIVVANPWWRLAALLRRQTVPPSPRGPSLRRVLTALRGAGFGRPETFLMFPSANTVRYLRPRALRGIWRSRHYLVTAGVAGESGTRQLDAILRSVVSAHAKAEDTVYRLRGVTCSAKDKSICFLEAGDSKLVVRVPHSDAALARERKAFDLIGSLAAEERLRGRIPRPVHRSAGAPAVFAETRVPGIPLASVLPAGSRAAYVVEVDRFLRELNPGMDAIQPAPEQRGAIVDLEAPLAARVFACLGDPVLQREAHQLFASLLEGAVCRPGLVHGDLSVSNIYVHEGKLSGVIDWENCRDHAPPVLDALNYLDSVQRHCSRTMLLADTVPLLASGRWPVEGEAEFLQAFFEFCGADRRFLPGFALLYFLHHVEPQLGFQNGAHAPRKHIQAVLKRLLR